jgi:hypothetical protein
MKTLEKLRAPCAERSLGFMLESARDWRNDENLSTGDKPRRNGA